MAIVAAASVAAVLSWTIVVHEVSSNFGRWQPKHMLLSGLRGPGNWDRAGVQDATYTGTAIRSWNRGRDDFGEFAYGFGSAGAAKREFNSSPPEKLEPEMYAGATPDDIGVRAPGADQAEYTCGEREQGECDAWWAWLRFGKVTVMLQYRHEPGDPQALTDAELAVLVTNAAEDLAALSG